MARATQTECIQAGTYVGITTGVCAVQTRQRVQRPCAGVGAVPPRWDIHIMKLVQMWDIAGDSAPVPRGISYGSIAFVRLLLNKTSQIMSYGI